MAENGLSRRIGRMKCIATPTANMVPRYIPIIDEIMVISSLGFQAATTARS
jgi:hypothetical protein